MKELFRIPKDSLNLRMSQWAYLVMCYILASAHSPEDVVRLDPLEILFDLLGDDKVRSLNTRRYNHVVEGILELYENGFIRVEAKKYAHVEVYEVEMLEPLKKSYYERINNYDGAGAVSWAAVQQIFRGVSQRMQFIDLCRSLKAYLYLVNNPYDPPELPVEFRGKFLVHAVSKLKKYMYPNHGLYRGFELARLRIEKLIKLGVVSRQYLPKPIQYFDENGKQTSIQSITSIKATQEETDRFQGWLYQTYTKKKEEKVHKPVFRYRDELYKGYPAKLIHDYKGNDPDFLELRKQMIEEWTQ